MNLSIIIVNYKTPNLIINCVNSIKSTLPETFEYEIIIVDNNSNDDSEKIINNSLKNIKWINKNENDGFGRANNVGYKQSKGDYILFINSDVVVCENTILDSYKKIKSNSEIGVLGCNLLNEDGSNQHSVYYHFASLKSQLEKNLLFDYFYKFKRDNIKAIMGSYMLVPRKILEEVGCFDPDFFMYSEEIELCNRILKAGYKIYFYKEVSAYHIHGASSKNIEWSSNQKLVSNALLVLKLHGVFIYLLYFLFGFLNSVSNLFLMWFVGKEYRRDFITDEKIFYRNYFYYIIIPFLYKKNIGNGKRFLKRA